MAELDHAAELAEEAAKEVVSVAHNHINWMWGGAVVGIGIGFGGGFAFANLRLRTKYEKIAEDEIGEMRDHFRKRLAVRDTKPDLSDLNRRVADLGYSETVEPPAPPPGAPNVLTPPPTTQAPIVSPPDDPNWNWDEETTFRAHNKVYVLHRDEFGEGDYETTNLTYYAGDDVLADSSDRIIDDQRKLVGDTMDRFGHGSGDDGTVYVRNETLGIDMEVVRADKTYAEEVHGFKHEDPPRRRVDQRRRL